MAIIQGCLGIVAETERSDFLSRVSKEWKQTEMFYWSPVVPYTIYKCRLFIHQAKVRPGNDKSGLSDAYVRVMFAGQTAQTSIEHATLSPVWNAVITFQNIMLPGAVEWYIRNPPLVAIEIFDEDRFSDDYLGVGKLALSVIALNQHTTSLEQYTSELRPSLFEDRASIDKTRPSVGNKRLSIIQTKKAIQKFSELKHLSPPPLKWIPIAQQGAIRAEVLISGELVQIKEEINELQQSSSDNLCSIGIPQSIRPNIKNYV